MRITSPDLEDVLEGGVYLATPASNGENANNPFDSLIALYIVAEDPPTCGQPGRPRCSGVRVKLAGSASINQQTGQLSTTFEDSPQAPVEELGLHFFEGPHASLSTPPFCDSYNLTSTFTSWSGATRTPASEPPFDIASGPAGGACPSDPLPFSPAFAPGVSNTQAGAFTPFTLQIANSDGSQPLTGVTVHLPPGIAALLSTVTPCPEPAVGQEWTCGPDSLIGHSTAWAGLGTEPYALPGEAFLTNGYDGAPFALLVRTPAVAGPFNLGIVNVRSRIEVDPSTAAVTITTDPGPQLLHPVERRAGGAQTDRCERQPAGVRVQPHHLQPRGNHRHPHRLPERERERLQPLPRAHGLPEPAVSPHVYRLHLGKTSKANGASLGVTFIGQHG